MLEKLSLSHDKIQLSAKNTKTEKMFKVSAFVCFAVMVIAQIVLCFVFDGPQISDSRVYLGLANKVISDNSWYPNENLLSEPFFFGNGYINLIALVLRFTDSLIPLFILNMIFVQITLWSCFYIIKKYVNNIYAHYIFIIIFCMLNTFWSEVVQIRTELPFTAVAFLALALITSQKKYLYPISGILFALANWIRPLGIAFLTGTIVLIVCQNRKLSNILKMLGSYLITIVLIGAFTFSICGHFVYQSTTLGYNLIMSANDEADGSFMDVTSEGKVGYISKEQKEQMIFKDYDNYYKKMSIDWILKNPVKYIMQIPKKLFYLYSTETYSGSTYFNNEIDTGGIDYIKSVYNKITGNVQEKITLGDCLIIFNQLWYMLIAILFILNIFYSIKENHWRFMLPHYIIMLLGTGITMLIVGGARYHFPYLPIMIMGASFTVDFLINYNKKERQ